MPPASVRAALGIRLPLNRVTEAELARLPGVGAAAARALVQARPFHSWHEVDAVRGVGPARLRLLQQGTELDP
jgi:competence protein ComEA